MSDVTPMSQVMSRDCHAVTSLVTLGVSHATYTAPHRTAPKKLVVAVVCGVSGYSRIRSNGDLHAATTIGFGEIR